MREQPIAIIALPRSRILEKLQMGLLKNIAAKVLSRRVLTGPAKRFVFLYHDISEPDAPQYSPLYSTLPNSFKTQIDLLAGSFKLVSLDEIVTQASNNQERLASITFDDGFLSVKDEALPFLRSRGIPFSVFVNSMAIKHNQLFNAPGGTGPAVALSEKAYLDEAEIQQLTAAGVTIGSHSATHKVLAACDEATLKQEVLDNKLYLEDLTGNEVRHLALPFGKREHYNEKVLDYCYSVGHNFVFSTNPSYFELKSHQRLIPRIALLNETPEELLFAINRPLLKKIDI
ncbi:MAG TPA: polysaccharide deacetylase family protein [Pyrinomonadaceae bacterium]|nr:polysaccharide deacetylase family protein [Pyrinomonadaceae bacterium]